MQTATIAYRQEFIYLKRRRCRQQQLHIDENLFEKKKMQTATIAYRREFIYLKRRRCRQQQLHIDENLFI